MAATSFKTIGKPRRRVDGRAKVTGQTKFADDLMLPRMVHCKLLRSTLPHARVVRIAASRALAHPGVHLVMTGRAFPTPCGILPVSKDEHALAIDRVRFVGDPVAAVIARDELTALDALALTAAEYEPLRTFADPEESLTHSTPRIHDYGDAGNIHKIVSLGFGDVEEAFADADHVFEDTFFYQGSTHLPIEQHAAVAAKDPDGKLVLWSSTQTPHYVHRALAKALAIPAAHVRVIATPNGGGFGGKSDPFNHEVVIAKAAMLLDRPVKICLTREEVFYCHRGRHPVLMHFKTGVKRDGTITGLHLKTLLDGGAYGSYGVASTFYTGALQTVTYHIPAYHFQGCRVFTNKPPCGPKRGHVTPPSRLGPEIQLAKIPDTLAVATPGIRAVTGGTDLTPVDLGSYSSRVTLMMGNAAIQAAERAREIIADAVSRKLEIPKDRLVFAERRVFDAEDPAKGVSFSEAVCVAEATFGTVGTTGSCQPPRAAARLKS